MINTQPLKHRYKPLTRYCVKNFKTNGFVSKLDGVGPVDNRPSTD